MLSTPPLLILVLHCLFKAFPNLFQILAPHDKQTANPTSVWNDVMTDILVALICTANILFHTEIQNFFPFLSYSSHSREKKGRDLVLNLPHLLNQHNSSHGIEHCTAITRNSTCSRFPSSKMGSTQWDTPGSTENQFSHPLHERWVGYLSEGCAPAQCSAVPACQQVICHGPSGHVALAHPTHGTVWNYPSPTCSSTKPQLCGGDQIKINLP